MYECMCESVTLLEEDYVTFYATPNPFLLNEICLNECLKHIPEKHYEKQRKQT